jgi:Transposase DDE domain
MSNSEPRKVHIAEIRKTYKGTTYVSWYLRRTFREDGKVKHETLGNLSDLPGDLIELMKTRLATAQPLVGAGETMTIKRSLPHGNVDAVLRTLRSIELDLMIAARPCRERDLVMAMIVDRVISPGSKLSCTRGMDDETAQNTLAEELGLGDVDVHELYNAMDWLLERQNRIENKLAKKHLKGGSLVLFDVSSSYYTRKKSSLRQFGYSRDHRRDRPQIVYGLLCDPQGRPISVEVLPGNMADPSAFTSLVQRVRKRFGIERVIFVGDRGMITTKRIDEDLRGVDGLDWISALRSEGIRALVQAGKIDRSLFDEKDLAEISAEELFPGERLVVCRNPILADERARKREELLRATEKDLDVIVRATQRAKNPLAGKEKIGLRVGRVIAQHKMEKHFELTITETSFTYARREENIRAEAALDGLYVVRASVSKETMTSEELVSTYKSLAQVERAFRSMKTIDLRVRPIYHFNDDRIRAHVFLCMLAYYVEWHMRDCLSEILFDDDDRESSRKSRRSVVAPAARSKSARNKDASLRTASNLPVQSFQDLLKDLATLCRNTVRLEASGVEFSQLTESTPLQRRVFELIQTSP